MEKLRERDDVAYVRFASVYREFHDIETFMREIQKLKENERDGKEG
jgi:transcriptional repressor NrdR